MGITMGPSVDNVFELVNSRSSMSTPTQDRSRDDPPSPPPQPPPSPAHWNRLVSLEFLAPLEI
ncbi:hypothetical protein AA0113_g2503 [Alternaria arborescens]|uniref:Uncharacterized protein n=1 Tax=Alternaria arborescens TaxID=156630 RepID=A0A4Q4SJM0_9PLEO|nr:hypothetical protein AA0111_g5636 [Alternaria arborescens]RYN36741.1 hypothetical protein AA0112_g4650 [Alternaria arborescens]RYO30301.1 hypothetical protein AA0111_g5636 [Alternaria arborescens]RYO70880.1 hypothetical protein AA0113_g2503 [Alternaria arborescens]